MQYKCFSQRDLSISILRDLSISSSVLTFHSSQLNLLHRHFAAGKQIQEQQNFSFTFHVGYQGFQRAILLKSLTEVIIELMSATVQNMLLVLPSLRIKESTLETEQIL